MSIDDLAKAIEFDALYREIVGGSATSTTKMASEILAKYNAAESQAGDMRAVLKGAAQELAHEASRISGTREHIEQAIHDTFECDCEESHG